MITKEQALKCNQFVHVEMKGKSGINIRCRRNGQTKTWKTRPNEFKVPVKYGLYDYFYITQDNANEWDVFNY